MGSGSVAEEQLVRELYAAHAPALLGYASRLLRGDMARAEDVVQETLLRAWQHPAAIERAGREGLSIRSWLLTVARRVVIDGERRRAARPREVAEPTADRTGRPDPAMDRFEVCDAVVQAVAVLRPEHRQVIVELYLRDRSVADVARALAIPEGTVKSRAYHAVRALRAGLAEQGVLP